MRGKKHRLQALWLILLGTLLLAIPPTPAKAQWALTQEEEAYIAGKKVLTAASLDGIAPIQYLNARGEIQGISIQVLQAISEQTGLEFEYRLYDSLDEVFECDADLIFGIPRHYTSEEFVLSTPYLTSETILYINSSLDADHLEDKTYAAVKGSALPEGVEEKHSIYFHTREQSLDAVESGQADYGYGNAYSVSFYKVKNNYRNIVTIPKSKEPREYGIGFIKPDDRLLSIINKAIDSINEKQMLNIILEETSHVERAITFSMMMSAYGEEIMLVALLVVGVLLLSMVRNVHTNNQLRMQNKRHELLAQITNEYIYEYCAASGKLQLSEKCSQLFGSPEQRRAVAEILKSALFAKGQEEENTFTLKLPLADGTTGVFKSIHLSMYDDNGKLYSILGKLMDVSREAAEKEELILKSQRDGLTGLYNATTAKERIIERLRSRGDQLDAFLLMDCDKFKEINDTYGHLTGNQILEHLGRSLKLVFRSTDIIGRMGGDEFCVYIRDIPSHDFTQLKFQQLSSRIKNVIEDIDVSISAGVVLVRKAVAYDDLFEQADSALYQAKRMGGARMVLSGLAGDTL